MGRAVIHDPDHAMSGLGGLLAHDLRDQSTLGKLVDSGKGSRLLVASKYQDAQAQHDRALSVVLLDVSFPVSNLPNAAPLSSRVANTIGPLATW
jgi:hypothetical protein